MNVEQRNIDISVARHIFVRDMEAALKTGYASIPRYSTDLSAAYDILASKTMQAWEVIRMANNQWRASTTVNGRRFSAESNILPEAICKAALYAAMESA